MAAATRRTKIVATLGPASNSPEMVRKLIDAGVNVFRLNFSHGKQAEHAECIRRVRAAATEAGLFVAILQDLQGPKIRVGAMTDRKPILLEAGKRLRIVTEPVIGTPECISTTYEPLPDDVRIGDMILLDDGRLQLRVVAKEGRAVIVEVVIGGPLGENKGMNLPGTPLSAPCLTEKDISDLRFGVAQGVDYISLSFVRQAQDIREVRRLCREAGRDVPVVAKIERVEAVERLEEIVDAADAIMVARGDLGVETGPAEIPILQKQILDVAGRMGKPDITATQMLETMVENPLPSRAEATDVANAVFDGTDAVMLSAETAMGKYPAEAVRMMAQIAAHAEEHLAEFRRATPRRRSGEPVSVAEAAAHAACVAADELNAKAIAVFTLSGRTAFMVSARRPTVPIMAFSPHPETCRRLALAWGVQAWGTEMAPQGADLSVTVERALRGNHLLKEGDLVVIVAGSDMVPGATNLMKIHRMGGR
jgi:pyruvate kinase